jgi:hypothetical protein
MNREPAPKQGTGRKKAPPETMDFKSDGISRIDNCMHEYFI